MLSTLDDVGLVGISTIIVVFIRDKLVPLILAENRITVDEKQYLPNHLLWLDLCLFSQ